MVDRLHIQRILRLNGVSEIASPEEIKMVLLKAGLSLRDLDTVALFSENIVTNNEIATGGVQTLFKTDNALNPEHISSLLGIRVQVSKIQLEKEYSVVSKAVFALQVLCTVTFTFLFATAGVIALLWYTKTGFFHVGSHFDI